MMNSLTVRALFSAAHLYAQPSWSEDRNRREFGRCFTPHGHGHNYRLEAEFEMPATHLSEADVAELQKIVDAEADRLDHVHLNFVDPDFAKRVPTTENIARVLRQRIINRRPPAALLRLRLYEMDDLWVEILA